MGRKGQPGQKKVNLKQKNAKNEKKFVMMVFYSMYTNTQKTTTLSFLQVGRLQLTIYIHRGAFPFYRVSTQKRSDVSLSDGDVISFRVHVCVHGEFQTLLPRSPS